MATDAGTAEVGDLLRLTGEALAIASRGAAEYEVRLYPDATLALTGAPVASLNVGLVHRTVPAVPRLREFIEVVRRKNISTVFMLPSAVSDQIAAVASDAGLAPAGSVPLMTYRPGDTRAPSGLYQIARAIDREDLAASNALMSAAFRFPSDTVLRAFGPRVLEGPGLSVFLARRDGRPISTLWAAQAGAHVGIFNMATRPEDQGRGAGRALLDQAIAHYRQRGAERIYLGASEAGYPLYQRVGFQTVGEASVWITAQQ